MEVKQRQLRCEDLRAERQTCTPLRLSITAAHSFDSRAGAPAFIKTNMRVLSGMSEPGEIDG